MTLEDAQMRVQSELQAGESLRWSGVTDARRAAFAAIPEVSPARAGDPKVAGWGARIRTCEWWIQKSTVPPLGAIGVVVA